MRLYPALGFLAALTLSGCATDNTVHEKGYAILKVNRYLLNRDGDETEVVGDMKEQAMYQYNLRNSPLEQTGVRFHVRWKAPDNARQITLRIDVRGLNERNETILDSVLMSIAENDDWTQWTEMEIAGAQFKRLGRIQAWKATLSSTGEVKAELPSGNWYQDIKANNS